MFKRNKQPYLLQGLKQIKAKTVLQEHPEKQGDTGSLPDPNPPLSASPDYHSSEFKGIWEHLMCFKRGLLKTPAERRNAVTRRKPLRSNEAAVAPRV